MSKIKNNPVSRNLIVLILSFAAPGLCFGQDASSDKSQHNLFNRTPDHLKRELSADRPDVTESAYSVDAGHFQFELSFFDYAKNKDSGVSEESYSIMPTNFKIGITNDMDLQFVVAAFETYKDKSSSEPVKRKRFSDDMQIRLKKNLWGNDHGDTALSLMPYIKLPTGSGELSNNKVEGGLIAPFAMNLPAEFSLGAMAELDLVYNEENDNYDTDFLHTIAIGRGIYGDLAGYAEFIGILPNELQSSYQTIFSCGFTYEVNPDWILDTGATFGLSRNTDDKTFFIGTTFRI